MPLMFSKFPLLHEYKEIDVRLPLPPPHVASSTPRLTTILLQDWR
ncbi:hypothetical protein LT85_1400 [Collimonas arenae]|uniref:Uncharacterized protein n=1 Tax=Collimonas arenae TaxID=279058 RepID=A0A0A1F753_9BURK|nr:hypothetical protein LT85_1400 [Collimonas arenae]